MELYENIKALRVARGWSQQRLADLTGYGDRSSIAKIESGKVDLPRSKIAEFAKIFNVTPAYLMGWDEDAPSTPIPGKEQLQAAFWGGDKDLTQDEKDAMWDDVERFAAFLAQQKKQEKQKDD